MAHVSEATPVALKDLFFGVDVFNRTGRDNIRGDQLQAMLGVGIEQAHSSMQFGPPQVGPSDLFFTSAATTPGSPVDISVGSFIGPEKGINAALAFPTSFTIPAGIGGGEFLVSFDAELSTFTSFISSLPGVLWELWLVINGTNTQLRCMGNTPALVTETNHVGFTNIVTLADGDVINMRAEPQAGSPSSGLGAKASTFSIVSCNTFAGLV